MDEETEVELIEPMDDARLRLECFQTILGAMHATWTLEEVQKRAELLYAWVMNYEVNISAEDGAELAAIASKEELPRKH